MREPLHHWDAPADVAALHPSVGPWTRVGIWRRAKKKWHLEAVYEQADKRRCAVVHRDTIRSVDVIQWSIENGRAVPFPAVHATRDTGTTVRKAGRRRPGSAARRGNGERAA